MRKLNQPRSSKRHSRDEPDAFRRAVERWTLRMLLTIVTVVLAFELVAWATQKIRRCMHEIMDDNGAKVVTATALPGAVGDRPHENSTCGCGVFATKALS